MFQPSLLVSIIGTMTMIRTDHNIQYLVNAINYDSFKLIFTDAKNDGKKALEILSDRYLGSKSDLDVELLTELFDVKIQCNEDHTKFVSRFDLIKSQLESNNIKLPDKASHDIPQNSIQQQQQLQTALSLNNIDLKPKINQTKAMFPSNCLYINFVI